MNMGMMAGLAVMVDLAVSAGASVADKPAGVGPNPGTEPRPPE